jgi:ABC-type xylose transport system permease subunit
MKTLATLFKNNIRQYGMLIALIAVMLFFQVATNGILFKPVNIGKFQPRAAIPATKLTFVNHQVVVINNYLGFVLQNFAFWAFVNLKTSP